MTGEVKRATIIGFDADGNAILEFKDNPGVQQTVSKEEIRNRIKGAPEPLARLYTPQEEAKKSGGGGGGGGGGGAAKKKADGGGGGGDKAKAKGSGGGGGGGGTDKAAADQAKKDKAAQVQKAHADKAAQMQQAHADKAAATKAQQAKTQKSKAEKAALVAKIRKQREEEKKAAAEIVLPSSIKTGGKVRIGNSPVQWTVGEQRRLHNGTLVVDLSGPRGAKETNYPITGPNGKRLTRGQVRLTSVA